MKISKLETKLMAIIIAAVMILTGFVYMPKTVSADEQAASQADDNAPTVEVLGATLRLNNEGDNAGTQSMRVGIKVKRADRAKACAITLNIGDNSYTVGTKDFGDVNKVSDYVYSKNEEENSIVYTLVITGIPVGSFDTKIGITGKAIAINEAINVTPDTKSKSVKGIVEALTNDFAGLNITLDNGILYKNVNGKKIKLTTGDINNYSSDISGEIADISRVNTDRGAAYNTETGNIEVDDVRTGDSDTTEMHIPIPVIVKPRQTVTITIEGPSWGTSDFRVWTVPSDKNNSGNYVQNNSMYLNPNNGGARVGEPFKGTITLTAKAIDCDYITLKPSVGTKIKELKISGIKVVLGPEPEMIAPTQKTAPENDIVKDGTFDNFDSSSWSKNYGGQQIVENIDGNNILKVTGRNNQYSDMQKVLKGEFKKGDIITVACDAYTDDQKADGCRILLEYCGKEKYGDDKAKLIASEWNSIEKTFIVKEDTNEIKVHFRVQNYDKGEGTVLNSDFYLDNVFVQHISPTYQCGWNEDETEYTVPLFNNTISIVKNCTTESNSDGSYTITALEDDAEFGIKIPEEIYKENDFRTMEITYSDMTWNGEYNYSLYYNTNDLNADRSDIRSDPTPTESSGTLTINAEESKRNLGAVKFWSFRKGSKITIKSVKLTNLKYEKYPPIGNADLDVYKTDKTISIDGIIDEAWQDVEATEIKNYQNKQGDTTANVKMLWDNKNLYMLVQVTDPENSYLNGNPWERDGIEFFLDEDNSKENTYAANKDAFQYRYTGLGEDAKNANKHFNSIDAHNPKVEELYGGKIKTAHKLTERTGYVIEAVIPFASSRNVQVGCGMGFDIKVMDCSATTDENGNVTGKRNQEIGLFAKGEASLYNNPSLMGTIRLLEKGVAVPTAAPTPEVPAKVTLSKDNEAAANTNITYEDGKAKCAFEPDSAGHGVYWYLNGNKGVDLSKYKIVINYEGASTEKPYSMLAELKSGCVKGDYWGHKGTIFGGTIYFGTDASGSGKIELSADSGITEEIFVKYNTWVNEETGAKPREDSAVFTITSIDIVKK